MEGQLTFKLDVFEGPMELLLFLIGKHKLDIQDIAIAELLEQYLDYLEEARALNQPITGAFLSMAAHLIYIKTVSLLPRKEEAKQLKEELENRLQLYQMFRMLAGALSKQDQYGKTFLHPQQAAHSPAEMYYNCVHEKELLSECFVQALGKQWQKRPLQQETFAPLVSAKLVSVQSKIIYLLRRLYQSGRVNYSEVYQPGERSGNIATFLAVLELIRAGRIALEENDTVLVFQNRRNQGKAEE
jgi:segregation and condensation protein A